MWEGLLGLPSGWWPSSLLPLLVAVSAAYAAPVIRASDKLAVNKLLSKQLLRATKSSADDRDKIQDQNLKGVPC